MYCEFVLVRHGETAWNKEGRLQGQQLLGNALGPPLDDVGEQQAVLMAHLLQQHFPCVNAVYSSDLLRAVQTAQVVAAAYGLQPQQHKGLRERHWGILQGLTLKEIPEMQPEAWTAMQSEDSSTPLPGGESMDDVMHRVTAAVLDIARTHPGQRIVLVSHGGALHSLHRAARGCAAQGKVSNCSISTLLVQADCCSSSQPAHLRQQQSSLKHPGADGSCCRCCDNASGMSSTVTGDTCSCSAQGVDGTSPVLGAARSEMQQCEWRCVKGGRLSLVTWNDSFDLPVVQQTPPPGNVAGPVISMPSSKTLCTPDVCWQPVST